MSILGLPSLFLRSTAGFHQQLEFGFAWLSLSPMFCLAMFPLFPCCVVWAKDHPGDQDHHYNKPSSQYY
jgi:hypothetical protein